MYEINNTHHEGTVPNETDFINDFYEHSKLNSDVKELPANTVRSLAYFFISALNKGIEPTCYEESVLDSNWIDALNAEIEALNENQTWIIVDLPANRKAIGNKWIYKIKYKSSGNIERYKTRLVVKGFNQKEGIDFDETFSLVVKMSTVRYVIALSVTNNWPLSQLDSANDHSLFTKSKNNKFIALLVYVDDIVVTENCVDEIDKFKSFLKSKFKIKDLGHLKYFLDYGLLGCKPVSTPMVPNSVLPYEPTKDDPFLDNITGYQKLLEKLIYLTHTRPDIAYSVHCLAQYMHSPLKSHLSCALDVLRYLKGALGKGTRYKYPDIKDTICGYSDADWAKCLKTRKSVTGLTQQAEDVSSYIKVDIEIYTFNLMKLCKRGCGEGSATATDLLKVITSVVNLWLAGRCPPILAEFVASAPLTPLLKQDNEIRPIAVGIIWRRLVSKASRLYIRDTHIWSATKVQQGDPLRPLLFALILHPLLHKIKDSCKLILHAWPSSGVKLLGGAVSRYAYFISGLAVRRAANAVDLMSLLPQLHDPQNGLGQHMSPVEYYTILKYRLMIPLFSVDAICLVCRTTCLDSFGEHAVHCKELSGFKYRHDMVMDILFDICRRVGISAKKEAHVNFLTDPSDGRSTLRPDDVLVFIWAGRKHVCVDLTGVSPLVGLSSRVLQRVRLSRPIGGGATHPSSTGYA
nr:ribonuclease H-like domain-containing protein [Tanacetum cinerariifolium]